MHRSRRCLAYSHRHWNGPLVALLVVGLIVGFADIASASEAGHGVETFDSQILTTNGSAATEAGSHPYEWTLTFVLEHHPGEEGSIQPNVEVQNVDVNLPPGMVVNPSATTTRCSEAALESAGICPGSSVVGEDDYSFGIKEASQGKEPVYNMETPPQEPAELAFRALEGTIVHILGNVRTGSDYGLAAEVPDVNQQARVWANTITLYGEPKEARLPFLTLPTSCGSPLTTSLSANSWQDPAAYTVEASAFSDDSEGDPVPVTGCEKLSFSPSLSVQPTTHAASSPTGLNVELTVPQEESFDGLAEADLRNAVVTLPAGMSGSPAVANGTLGACSPQQIGLTEASSPSCPKSSKIGTVEVATPLLEQPLDGSVYLAQQGINQFPQEGSNPFDSLIALYLVIEGKGVVLKVPGEVSMDPVTGQLTTRFGEDPEVEEGNPAVTGHLLLPQIPFSHLKLDFFGGARAALVTPPTCGTYAVTSSLTPYSAPESGPPATPSSSFEINERCNGGQFNPSLVAGTENNQAGGFSPMTVRLSLSEALEPEQEMERIQVKMPPGLLGEVPSVTLCKEPQAEQGTCGQESLIGHVTTGVGAGPDPLYVTGEVFLTESYEGAPFGLSIVAPAVAGPFDLGVVKVRAAVNIDPETAALTVTSDPLPRILDGIPLHIRTVDVDVGREHFILNPTNCAPMSIHAQVTGTLGASASLSSPFEAANCAALGFAPKFSVSVSGRSSRVNGTSLDARIAYLAGAQANIAQAKFELPKQLPSRLKTLQKACPAAVFDANPASCPAASTVGIVRATTPVLSGTLNGPVYFVSHGGEAFPDLDVVLQGDGVRADLVGSTFISKASVTSSTFKSLPDVPVSSFELYLPAGPDSALTANGNLCKSSLAMPTTFIAQNGTELRQSTPIAVSGCPKSTKKPKKAKKPSKARKASKGRRAPGTRKAGHSKPVGTGGR
jgi:hypothetical protein